MVQADGNNLLDLRAERNPVLRRRTTLRRLLGNAAETVGIAHRRHRYPRFPAMIKEILRRAAMPLQRTIRQLFHNPVLRQLTANRGNFFG